MVVGLSPLGQVVNACVDMVRIRIISPNANTVAVSLKRVLHEDLMGLAKITLFCAFLGIGVFHAIGAFLMVKSAPRTFIP